MSNPQPVLVIHGIANREQTAFENTVKQLGRSLGRAWHLIPVYWGNLGAATDGIEDIIPRRVVNSPSTSSAMLAGDQAVLKTIFASRSTSTGVRSDDTKCELVVQGARAGGMENGSRAVRGPGQTVPDIEEGIRAAWPKVRWLKLIENPDVLTGIGDSLATTADGLAPTETGGSRVRAILGIDLKKWTEATVNAIDRSMGHVLGELGGQINAYIRSTAISNFTEYVGDILVYQRQSRAIQARLWVAINKSAVGYGIESRPIDVLAHSLGGIITLDAALSQARPLWIRTLVTFGSQPAFFQVMDAREGLPKYATGRPVKLPATIKHWVNFWETLDVLAFRQGLVFQLNSGTAPSDHELEHRVSSGLWTHSSYWDLNEFAQNAREALTKGALAAAPST